MQRRHSVLQNWNIISLCDFLRKCLGESKCPFTDMSAHHIVCLSVSAVCNHILHQFHSIEHFAFKTKQLACKAGVKREKDVYVPLKNPFNLYSVNFACHMIQINSICFTCNFGIQKPQRNVQRRICSIWKYFFGIPCKI